MDLVEPKAKKNCKLRPNLPLPISLNKDGSIRKFEAVFNGFSVVVSGEDDMKRMISQGYFGKANFSRSYPNFVNGSKIIRQRQFNHRKNNVQKFTSIPKPQKVIVVPNSDSENEDYFTNLQPKYELDHSGLEERVWLGLEEAFFLATAVECLNISHKGEVLDNDTLWDIFIHTQPSFKINYIVYYYYRAKNWVVKPGIKFGGDFLLYKQGPPFYHATYVVLVEVVDENNIRQESLVNRSTDNVSLLSLNRLCETAGKELLLCRLKWPSTKEVNYKDLKSVEVQEILVRRWISSQERENM